MHIIIHYRSFTNCKIKKEVFHVWIFTESSLLSGAELGTWKKSFLADGFSSHWGLKLTRNLWCFMTGGRQICCHGLVFGERSILHCDQWWNLFSFIITEFIETFGTYLTKYHWEDGCCCGYFRGKPTPVSICSWFMGGLWPWAYEKGFFPKQAHDPFDSEPCSLIHVNCGGELLTQ